MANERLRTHFEVAALPDAEFVESAFHLVLRRPPDDEARRYTNEALGSNGLSRASLLAELFASAEFKRLRILEDAVVEGTAWREAGTRPRGLVAPADFDPRPVEFIWTLSRYGGEPRVLDVGYGNADPLWLTALTAAQPSELVGVDLVERDVPGLRSVVADVRDLPFSDASFDVIFCVSTIEHIGADNTRYGFGAENEPCAPLDALRELQRVTAAEGRVLLTVPCGDLADDWSVRQARSTWLDWFGRAGFDVSESEIYAQEDGYWTSGDGETGLLCVELVPAN